MAAGDQLGQRQLRLLAARQRPRVLSRYVAGQPEHAQQSPQHPLLRVGLLPHVSQHRDPSPDPLVLLRVVARRNAVTEAKRPGIRLALPGQDAQQARLARAVQSHHEEALVALHLEGDVAKDERAAVTLGEAIGMQDDATAVRRVGKADLDLALAPRSGHALGLHSLDAGEDRVGLLGAFCRLPAHHLGKEAQPLDLRLLPLREGSQPLLLEPPRRLVLRVGAPILDQLARVQVQHSRDRCVQQGQVVAYHDHRPPIVAEEVHQPGLGVTVEVVGRLVQQQQVRIGEQHAS